MEFDIEIRKASETDANYRNLREVYGVRLMKGAYEALLTPPGMKNYVTNESRLSHGTMYAAGGRNNKYQQRKIALQVSLRGADYNDYLAKYEAFLGLLASGIVWVKVPRLRRVFKLVYTSCSRYNFYSRNWATFTIEMVEPDPTNRVVL